MAQNIQGVDLSTGKLYIPLTLASLTGPNGFGETFGIQYSTVGLPPLIRTWNQDAPTGILGLGWSFTMPSVIRLGNGSVYDTFLLNGQKLILTSLNPDPINTGCFILTFVTAVNSLLQITYQNASETWTVVDTDGTTYTYGRTPHGTNFDAVQYGVNWQNSDGQGPALWVGTSVQSGNNQNTYVQIWNLSFKTNIYGQQVEYTYTKRSLNVGQHGANWSYDTASYLVGINIVGGQALRLAYEEKQSWEYPPFRSNYETDGTITNAYQDRIETQYLSSAQVYDDLGQLQNNITFNYAYLWDNFALASNNASNLPYMNKRLLTSVTITTPDGYEVAPAHTFDYWGYGNNTSENTNDGYQTYFNSSDFNIMTMLNGTLDGSGFAPGYSLSPYQDASGNTYNQLFGHLKTIQSPEGSLTWYSYMQVADNYNEIGNDFSTQWQNQLDLQNITPPSIDGITWTCPRPFWGPDGYIVIRWYSDDEYNGNYQMCVVVYEWLGKWVPVLPQGYQTFTLYSWERNPMIDYQVISTGPGYFCLLITSPSSNVQGSVNIFNRNPNLTGEWQYTSYNETINLGTYLTDLPSDPLDFTDLVEVNTNNNIISILDKVALNLYLFGWNGQTWDYMTVGSSTLGPNPPSLGGFNSASTILGNDVFVLVTPLGVPSVNPQYFIYSYNSLSISNPWTLYTGSWPDINFIPEPSETVLYLQASPANGYIVVNALIDYTIKDNNSFFSPLIVSWDDSYNVSYQQIQQQGNWHFGISNFKQVVLPWIGQGNFSSVGNNLYYTASDAKTSFRYIGSLDANADSNGNVGWESQAMTSNITNDSFWGNLSLPEITIAAAGDKTITCTVYQYDPTSQTWLPANNISAALGSTIDSGEIIAIVGFSIQIVGLIISAIAPAGEFLPALAKIGQIVNFLTMPLSSITSLIVGTASAALLGETSEIVISTIFDLVAQQAEGIFQNYYLNNIIKRSLDNYSNGSLGSFIVCGPQYTSPSLFYNQWNSSTTPGTYGSYQWNSVNIPAPSNILYLTESPSHSVWNQGLTHGTFSAGNYCIPYSYIEITNYGAAYYYICSDQVVFLNNGQVIQATNMPTTSIPSQYTDEYSDFAVYQVSNGNSSSVISYQIDSYYETEGGYGSPLLTAPWGGVLGFLGQFYKSWDGYDHYQYNVDQAIEFGLFMAKDELLEGPVNDYVINKVAVSDGYQTNNTFFQFMPSLAAYDRAMNTARYNQIRVAQGSDSYTDSATQFGWTEYYLYNGGLYYNGSSYGNLPYDPASATDTFSTNNSTQTNASVYPNLMSGQTYCVRSMISQGSTDFLNGYEVARTQTFYYGFTKNVYDANCNQLSIQQVVGVVPTLTVNYTSPSITTYTDITEAFSNNGATLNYTYTFYDYPNLYGPWGPTGISSTIDYRLWNNEEQQEKGPTLETALPLATLTYTYSLCENNTTLNATYTQTLPGVIAYVQGVLDTTNPYYNFVSYNMYNSQVQTMSWQLNNVTPFNGFALPANTWGNDAWELASSQVSTWTYDNNIWYPNSVYTWQGNLDGTPQTLPYGFPWATPPTNDASQVWVQGDSVNQISLSGIVLSKVSSLGIPTFSIYDQQYFKNLATFTNAGILGGASFYFGFEIFENFGPWSLNTDSNNIPTFSFSSQSYTGNRSLSLESTNDISLYQLSYTPSQIDLSDTRSYVLSITLFSSIPNNNINIYVMADASNVLASQENITIGTTWTTLYLSSINFSSLSNITTLDIAFGNFSGTILVDNVSLMPATESSFTINSYDSVTDQILSIASFNNREFNTRYLYDNLQRPIGKIRKGSQTNAVDVINLITPYYSRFGNLNTFNLSDPNAIISLSAGIGSTAGYYFDFRDNLNSWNGGTIQDRLLILGNSVSSSFALPESNSYGFAIQVQIQGYTTDYSYSLSSGNIAIGLPAPTPAYSGAMWGCYATSTDYPTNIGFYSLTYSKANPNSTLGINEHATTTLQGFTPAFTEDGQLVASTIQGAYFGVFQDTNQNYGLYNLFIAGSKLIMSGNSDVSLFPVSLVRDNLLYISDNNNLYLVDVGSLNDNTTASNITPITVCRYTDSSSSISCPFRPTAGGISGEQIAIPLNDSTGSQTQIIVIDINSGNPNFTHQEILADDTIQCPLAIDEASNVFVIGTTTVYAFNYAAHSQESIQLTETPRFQPVAGNGIMALVFSGGQLTLYTSTLQLIAEIDVDDEIVGVPVINGNKISVIGQNTQTNQFTVYTYNTAGLLSTAPYVSNATQSLEIISYSTDSSLLLMEDASTFTQISLGVPSASISMGPYTVSWDAVASQFSLSGPNISGVNPVTVASTQGNWLFMLVNPVLYFYADGQQIFAITLDLDELPTGNFTITAEDNSISCRDILLINDPSLQISYRDGENKIRQVQQTAELNPVQTNNL